LHDALPIFPEGRAHLDAAVARAREHRPDLREAIDVIVPAIADPAHPAAQRMQMTSGPVMAKGVEDAAFYRYSRLTSLNEVGGDPAVFALDVPGLHAAFGARQAAWPQAMTALTTHDTKRSEDVRARLHVLAEVPEQWADALTRLCAIA